MCFFLPNRYNNALFALAPYGPLWREMRKMSILELLSTARLNDFTHVLVSELQAGMKDLYMLGKDNNWVNPQKVVMCEWVEHLITNAVLRMIAGKRYFDNLVHGGEGKNSTIVSVMKEISVVAGVFVASDAIPFLEFLDLQGHLSTMKEFSKRLDSIVESWVDEHEEAKLKSGSSSSIDQAGKKTRPDFIDVMLNKLDDVPMFGYSRKTMIKATVVVCSLSPFLFLS